MKVIARIESLRMTLTVVAALLAAGGLIAAAVLAGPAAVIDAALGIDPIWLLPCAVAVLAAPWAYAHAWRDVTAVYGERRASAAEAGEAVAAGFGPFALRSGMGVDHRALCAIVGSERAGAAVVGLAALEYAVLAPAACGCAIALLLTGHEVAKAVTIPWAVAVPAGFAIGMVLAAPVCAARVRPRALRRVLEGVAVLHAFAAHPLRHRAAWLGMTLYWTLEIFALWCALRAFGADLGMPVLVLAYATGYALTRRSMPLGGAGATELLLCLAISSIGTPLAVAVPAVAAYRVANLLLLAPGAAHAHAQLERRLRRRGTPLGDRPGAPRERPRAGTPPTPRAGSTT